MFTAYVVVTVLMSVVQILSATAKFLRPPRMVDQMTTLKVPDRLLPVLAVLQIAGTGGLIVGIWWAPLGIVAAVCLALYFVGAVGTHLRVRDLAGAPPAAVIAVAAVVLAVLRTLSR
ncbi:DoxX family protein [Kineosporia sp. J2-2]|uniref:DoxX family protein n=1 Tax=Kineosporia corallincola TaxID=2835133 RepID=A0ABS5TSB0_9ACTN|nr:DoxX family protein [Kineosporia corallincola]MBT0773684.1 DoxX family protein [Kineosporia corallincola]